MKFMSKVIAPNTDEADALINEVRAIRRSMCEEFDNDVQKLGEHLGIIEEEYRSRTGRFARVPRQVNDDIFPTSERSPAPFLET